METCPFIFQRIPAQSTLSLHATTLNYKVFLLPIINQTASWSEVTAGTDGPDAIANCRPLRCPDCKTKATCVAANAAASCFTKLQQNILVHKTTKQNR